MSKELVSVIVSAYNAEKTIEKSLNSILRQSYSSIELLIVNDASNDNTLTICKDLASKDNRIKIFNNNKNVGLTRSLNLLLQEAKGEYIARHDADDFSLEDRIEKQLEFIKKYNLDIVYARALLIQNKRKVIPALSFYTPKKIIVKYKNPYVHGTLLAKTSTFKLVNGYDENFYYAQDYKLITDLLDKNIQVKIMKDVLYYRNVQNNISTNNLEEQNYYAMCVRKNLIPNVKK